MGAVVAGVPVKAAANLGRRWSPKRRRGGNVACVGTTQSTGAAIPDGSSLFGTSNRSTAGVSVRRDARYCCRARQRPGGAASAATAAATPAVPPRSRHEPAPTLCFRRGAASRRHTRRPLATRRRAAPLVRGWLGGSRLRIQSRLARGRSEAGGAAEGLKNCGPGDPSSFGPPPRDAHRPTYTDNLGPYSGVLPSKNASRSALKAGASSQ